MPGVSSFNTRTGAVTLTSADVAGAVGVPAAGQLPVGNAGGTLYAPQTLAGVNCTISLDGSGNLTLTAVAKLAGTVTPTPAGTWTFNGNGGSDIVFQQGGSEICRLKGDGSTFFGGGPMIVTNTIRFPPNTASLGGSNINNYAVGTATMQRWSASGAINVTGMSAGNGGDVKIIWNVGAQTITLTNQDAGSTAANQWLTTTGANLALAANKCAIAEYDGTTAAWRVSLLP